MSRIITTNDGYTISYSGGRLADVLMGGKAIEVVQVRAVNGVTGEFGPEPTDEQIKRKVAEFIDPANTYDYELLAGIRRHPGAR